MRIDDAVRRFETESKIHRETFPRQNERYDDMQEDLTDIRVKLNEHMTKLHVREMILKDELDRLGSDTRTISGYQAPYQHSHEQIIHEDTGSKIYSARRRSFGDAHNSVHERLHQE